MNKKLFLLTSILYFSLFASGQDIIITTAGDTIHCKIDKIRENYIFYSYNTTGGLTSSGIPKTDVKGYQVGAKLQEDVVFAATGSPSYFTKYNLGVSAGLSYMLGKTSSIEDEIIREYVNELKSGYAWGAHFTYYRKKHLGYGLMYSHFRTSNELNDVYYTVDKSSRPYKGISDNIRCNFYGATLSGRFFPAKNEKYILSANLSLGYTDYKNEARFAGDFTLTGSTISLYHSLRADYKFFENGWLGLQINYHSGSISNFQKDDGKNTETIKLEDGNKESLTRVELMLGIRWNF